MPKLLEVEEHDSLLPLLLLFGENHELLERLVHENAKKFRIILVSSKKPSYLTTFPEIYFVPFKSLELLPKLADKIRYAAVFLPETELPIGPMVSKLNLDNAQTLVLFNTPAFDRQLGYFQEFHQLHNARFALLGELLFQRRKDKSSLLSKIIENVILNGEIRLHGNELQPVHAVSETDALLFINRILLGNFKKDTVHYLFYKNPETLLEASHLIGRVDSEIKFHFSETNTPPEGLTRSEISETVLNKLKLKESYIDPSKESFERAVGLLLDDREALLENIEITGSKKVDAGKYKSHILTAGRFLSLSIFFGIFLFIFVNFLFFGLGIFFLQNAFKNIESSNFTSASQNARLSNFFLGTIKPTVSLSLDAIALIDTNGTISKTYLLAERSGELSEIAGSTVSSLIRNEPISEKTATSAVSNFSYLYQEAQRIVLETDNKTVSSKLKNTYSKLLSLSSTLPVVLGYNGERKYLLLFQNNEELRPTGGFIGSVGDLTLKEGRVEDIVISDVYEIDGQLRRHFEPPHVVRRYLQPHLYLRDSNFSLNFQEAASQSAIIYNLVTQKRPDAVVAIDLTVLKEILKLTGPLSLPSYNVTVDDKTVSDFIQGTIKDTFFPGSTQKRDVLNAVMTQLVEKSKNDPKFYIAVAKLIPDMLEQKHILISFQDPSIQKVFSANGYGGEHQDQRSIGSRIINDYLYINESNIGVNKVNAFITREVTYKAVVGTDNITSIATLKLLNKSRHDEYKNYLTVALPRGSSLTGITVNGKKQDIIRAVTDPEIYESENFRAPGGLEVDQYVKDSLTNFGFLVTVSASQTTTVEIEYINGSGKRLTTLADYSLLYRKQPGTDPYPLKVTIHYPESFTPVDTTADSYGKNYLEVTEVINKDFKAENTLQKRKNL